MNALNDVEKAGLLKFLDVGCVACHSGTLLGRTAYQKLGAVKPWPNQADLGRAALTKNDADKFLFKVPSLRNVERRRRTSTTDRQTSWRTPSRKWPLTSLVAICPTRMRSRLPSFWAALTGDIPKEYIAEPQLPPSGKTTPKPDPA